jgi:hypothetical protein
MPILMAVHIGKTNGNTNGSVLLAILMAIAVVLVVFGGYSIGVWMS